MAKCLVVTRRLIDEDVPSAVIQPPDHEVDDLEHYLQSEAERHVGRFCNQFPEFKSAIFKFHFVECE